MNNLLVNKIQGSNLNTGFSIAQVNLYPPKSQLNLPVSTIPNRNINPEEGLNNRRNETDEMHEEPLNTSSKASPDHRMQMEESPRALHRFNNSAQSPETVLQPSMTTGMMVEPIRQSSNDLLSKRGPREDEMVEELSKKPSLALPPRPKNITNMLTPRNNA